jgi:hypothetical protein
MVKSCAKLLTKRIFTSPNWHINVVLQPTYTAPTTDNPFSVKNIHLFIFKKRFDRLKFNISVFLSTIKITAPYDFYFTNTSII